MDSSMVKVIGIGIAALAVLAAILLFSQNSSLRKELTSLHETQATLNHHAKGATERANVAERTMEETRAEMDRVRQESEQAKHSVTQLRVQLDQVQIQARRPRGARGQAENQGRATE